MQTTSTNTTTIILSLLGLAVAVAIGAIHIAGWKHKLLVWGLLAVAAVLAVAGVFWVPISAALPQVATVIGSVASAQFLWFLALLTALVSTISANMKVKRLRSSNSTDLAVIDREWKDANRLEKVEGELHAIRVKQFAIIDDYQRMLALEGRFDETKAELDKRVGELSAHHSLDADQVELRFSTVFTALAAIFDREQLYRRAQQLEEAVAELTAPTDLEAHYSQDQWDEWEAKERAWKASLDQWCSLAAKYLPTIREQVFTVPDALYKQKGEAKIGQFPDAEAYTAYKIFWAVLKNWREILPEVYGSVHAIAFDGHVPVRNALLPSYRGTK